MMFDLNLNNYTQKELIEMFELPEYFDKNIVEIKQTKLKDSIINNKDINTETKSQLMQFIINAKKLILNSHNTNNDANTNLQKKIENFYNSSYELKSIDLDSPEEHMLQVRKEKPYLSSFPSEFFPGVINPLKKRTIKKNLNIDTKFRDNYYANVSTNFNISLPLQVNDVIQMQLSSIELPTSYYVVSKQYGNNYFTITINNESIIIHIPDGNYDSNTIMNVINNELSILNPPFNNIVFKINLTNEITGSKQTIVGFNNVEDLPSNTTFELNFQADKNGAYDTNTPLPLKFGWLLGFRNGIYINNLNYVSEGIVDLKGSRYLFLVVDDYNNNVNNSFFSAFNESILNKNILARISLQTNTFNILEQNNLNILTTPREYFGPVKIQNLNIQLLDEYGRVVNLNNMDYSFCLTLTIIYDL